MPSLKYFLALFFILFFLTQACTPQGRDLPEYGKALGSIDDITIREDQLRFRIKLETRQLPAEVDKKVLAAEVLKKLIQDYSIISYGQKNNLLPDQTKLDELYQNYLKQWNAKALDELMTTTGLTKERFHELIQDQVSVQSIIDAAIGSKIKVDRSEVEQFYWLHVKNYNVSERVRVRHIVTEDFNKANDLLKRLQKGDNFAKLAINHSISPDRSTGGDLGYFARGTMPKVFDDACFKLEKKGDLSPVVRSEYGYHIFKLLDRIPAGRKDLSEVSGEIAQELTQEKIEQEFTKWYEEVKKNVQIKINHNVLDTLKL